jgi:hypothetical protein
VVIVAPGSAVFRREPTQDSNRGTLREVPARSVETSLARL